MKKVKIKIPLIEAPEDQPSAIKAVQQISFEEDPMNYILIKYPSLKETLVILMTDAFKDYLNGIYVVAPRPTTFKVVLHNNQEFFLIWTGKTYICKVEGKKYYLTFLSDKQRATNAIAQLLELGSPIGKPGPSEESTPQGPDDNAETGDETTGGDETGGSEEEAGAGEEEALAESKSTKRIKIKLLKEQRLLKEKTEEYDDIIKKQLKTKTIPLPSKKVKLGTDFKLTGKDLKIWQALFTLTPKTKGSQEASKGSGKGEIAAYWLLQGSGYNVEDGRGDESPDLIINGNTGVEIKSYGKPRVDLGKFSKDKQSLYLLNVVFSIDTLLSALRKEPGKEYSPANFSPQNLEAASATLAELDKNKELKQIAKKYNLELILSIFERIDAFKRILGLKNETSPESIASKLLAKLVTLKLSNKPNMGERVGYILDCLSNGEGTFYTVDLDKLKRVDPEIIKKAVSVSQAQIKVNFHLLFKQKS